LGIDEAQPRLSWQVQGASAASIKPLTVLVASSARSLAENKADLWDSGKVV
jgi:alpha-L-rhamnosidase